MRRPIDANYLSESTLPLQVSSQPPRDFGECAESNDLGKEPTGYAGSMAAGFASVAPQGDVRGRHGVNARRGRPVGRDGTFSKVFGD